MINPTSGYGQLAHTVGGLHVNLYAHRLAWILAHGIIPDDLTVDHVRERCKSKLCCNAGHMELDTLEENGRRGTAARWGTIGDNEKCRHGHVGERARDRSGFPYCRACNRLNQERRRRAAGVLPR
jgi:hypothetical protein